LALIHPSYREKRRYILVKVKDVEKFKIEFIEKFRYFFGIYGLAKAGVIFIKELCRENDYCVIRIARKFVHYSLVTLSSMKNVDLLGIYPTLKRVRSKIERIKKSR